MIQSALDTATRQLSHLETARLDAELLLSYVLGVKRSYLYAWPNYELSEQQVTQFQVLLNRRIQHEPIAYLTGRKEFWSLELQVTADTLIPRPETELLVEQALVRLPKNSPVQVVDLGTGSGAIALAIAQERPDCYVFATDNAKAALAIAQHNAQQLGLHQIQFIKSDWWSALESVTASLVVSNPPYIAIDDPHLKQGDVQYEPGYALVAGVDGLAALRLLIAQSVFHLNSKGWLLLEHGYDQADTVRTLFEQYTYQMITTYVDLAGQPRITAGQKP